MKVDNIQKAASQFGTGVPEITPLGNGLIHRTSKVTYSGEGDAVVLQCINQRVFPQPENIIQNYLAIYRHLENNQGLIMVPPLVPTKQHLFFWVDGDDKFWRAARFVSGSYTIQVPRTEKDAYEAARCFSMLTGALSTIDVTSLNVIIPGFHNLALRYRQFEEAISKAAIMRLLRATYLISELRQRKTLVDIYNRFGDELQYPLRAMHHDCKISNVLFNEHTHTAMCPVDLDTVMPGKFFSDIGDMIRTMVCPEDENSTAWEDIHVNKAYYQAVITGYCSGTGGFLTPTELAGIHVSGLIMTYMQAMRFVTDYLNNDVYYKTDYTEQNLNRALNQLLLLEELEQLLLKEYGYSAY